MADYTSRTLGQAEKPLIATSCVCTTYPHYVPLTLNYVSLWRTHAPFLAHCAPSRTSVEMFESRPTLCIKRAILKTEFGIPTEALLFRSY